MCLILQRSLNRNNRMHLFIHIHSIPLFNACPPELVPFLSLNDVTYYDPGIRFHKKKKQKKKHDTENYHML